MSERAGAFSAARASDGFSVILEAQADIVVAGEAGDGEEASARLWS